MTEYERTARARREAALARGGAALLAIETSCDETAAAVVKNGRQVLSNAVYTQIPLHRRYGGVVPEIASRDHVQHIGPVVRQAMEDAQLGWDDLDGVAVTYGPGLIGALLVGTSYAKGLAFSRGLPLIAVNHIAGHIAANYLSHPDLEPPFVCLVASGGHSDIVLVRDYDSFERLGRTRDDAAGEAFDKIARVLGLPYPGGPELEKLAREGDPRAMQFHSAFNAQPTLDFSFSGIKTAVINALHNAEQKGEAVNRADIAASFQECVISILAEKSVLAAVQEGASTLALAGGVSANQALRGRMEQLAHRAGLRFCCPEFRFCTDNAAMIGAAGYHAFRAGKLAPLSLNATARMELV